MQFNVFSESPYSGFEISSFVNWPNRDVTSWNKLRNKTRNPVEQQTCAASILLELNEVNVNLNVSV